MKGPVVRMNLVSAMSETGSKLFVDGNCIANNGLQSFCAPSVPWVVPVCAGSTTDTMLLLYVTLVERTIGTDVLSG